MSRLKDLCVRKRFLLLGFISFILLVTALLYFLYSPFAATQRKVVNASQATASTGSRLESVAKEYPLNTISSGLVYASAHAPFRDMGLLNANTTVQTAHELGFNLSMALYGQGRPLSRDDQWTESSFMATQKRAFLQHFPQLQNSLHSHSPFEKLSQVLWSDDSEDAEDPLLDRQDAILASDEKVEDHRKDDLLTPNPLSRSVQDWFEQNLRDSTLPLSTTATSSSGAREVVAVRLPITSLVLQPLSPSHTGDPQANSRFHKDLALSQMLSSMSSRSTFLQKGPPILVKPHPSDLKNERSHKAARAVLGDPENNAFSEMIYPNGASQGACLLEVSGASEQLEDILKVAFDMNASSELQKRAQELQLSASDIAFWLYAHESAHCLYSLLRHPPTLAPDALKSSSKKPALVSVHFSEQWAQKPAMMAYQYGGQGERLSEVLQGSRELPILARTEEIAADLWALHRVHRQFGAAKAKAMMILIQEARQYGGQHWDEIHDSSGVLQSLQDQALMPQGTAWHDLMRGSSSEALLASWKLAQSDSEQLAYSRYAFNAVSVDLMIDP